MRNWRLRTKLIAVLFVPTLTALALGGLRVKADLDRADAFRQTVSQVDLARNVTRVVHELQKERTLSVAWKALGDRSAPRQELDAQITRVDQAVVEANAAAARLETEAAVQQRYDRGLQRLTALKALRDAAKGTDYPDVSVFTSYSNILDALIQLGREVNTAVTDRELLREGTVIQALSEHKEFVGKENAILEIAASPARNQFPANLLDRVRAAQASSEATRDAFFANSAPAQQQLYSDTVSGTQVDNRERLKQTAIIRAENLQPLDFTPEARQQLTTDGFATVERIRTVETNLLDRLRAAADDQASAATNSAWRNAAYVLAALLLAVLLMLIVSRSLLKPLRVLRRDALDVANRRLPATVQRILADPDPVAAAKTAIDPVPVFTREETGQLARSFDAVHDQAVKMATEQALLRDNINSIFVNLSRRSQALVERQLALIDRLEQDEQDPDQLASLFELDHLATRMRRNSESLLVLSGSGLSRQLSRPVPASEVVGAAVSEVEHYARIEVVSAPEVTVQGRAVSDLVHLIAELLDNATFFSEPDKKVVVRMAVTRKKELAIQITDSGVGMSEEEIEAANQRLADPPDLDVAVTRRMGLYVVARLAKRHNIIVRLRDNEDIEGGLIARINVPADLIAPAGTATHALPSALHSDLDTTSSLAATGHTGQFTSPASRASGIAGAFTGGIPRLRPDSGLVGESQVDRPAQEVAGYPPFAPAYNPGGVSNANGVGDTQGGWTSKPTEAVADGGDGKRNGRSDEQPTTALFGNPLTDPAPSQPQQQPAVADTTGSQPLQEVALNVDAPTERLPIYEQVLSQWFESVDTGAHRAADTSRNGDAEGETPSANGEEPAAEEAPRPETKPWVSPGDEGWQAARALLENTGEDVLTNAGLPKRVPKAHLVPGSAAPRHEAAEAPPPPPLPPRSAEAVRGRMSSFQQGVRRGRHALIEAYAGDPSSSDESRKDEEQE
ncbi:MAG TPA: nitrate- and nitrite sensing domain-containing protein [Actinophytocola sp.]|uniref:sensor histidine kinase n=1 Tax=Actinophytocola sp. TaxID=1872138 RepID=UPI002DDCF7B3|nr:nitrate- and nitrite sensing domain-containing protein [Actinophytocola sp.]HEV2784481.1 nitrate- and nitrite sensing domain-containing protein [Actinophytocola sp.]